MKKNFIAAIAFTLCSVTCFAQSETDKNRSGEWEVSFSYVDKSNSSDSNVNQDTLLNYENSKGNFKVVKSRKKYVTSVGGFYLGFCDAVGGPDNMEVKLGSSVEIGIQNLFNAKYRPWSNNKRHAFSLGVGFGWKNYRMTGRQCFFKEDNGDITVSNFSDKYGDYGSTKFSRLKIFSWQFPLQYHYNFSKHLTLSLGGIINLNGDGSIKTRYYDTAGDDHERKYDDIHTNALTVDLLASLTFHGWGVYVRYNPCEILDTQYAPKFNAISVGAILIGW